MKLKDLLPNCDSEIEVSAIEIDSRLVKPGAIFFALKGHNSNGEDFIDAAFENGAKVTVVSFESLVVSRKSLVVSHKSGLIIEVDDVYESLVFALQKFYPNLPENILAVTGTNGKTSVAYFIMQLQEMLGKKSASIGTLGIKLLTNDSQPTTNDSKLTTNASSLTTPDIVSLYKNLSILKQQGINDVAIEASSIGLEQKRMAGIKIGLGAFTNFSQDHLDYHQTMEKYFECKMLLFQKTICDGGIAVLNQDIPEFEKIKEIAEKRSLRIISYSTKPSSLIAQLEFFNQQSEFRNSSSGIQMDSQSSFSDQQADKKNEVGNEKLFNNLPDFQKANLLCALTCVIAYYQPSEKQIDFLINNLGKIKPATGRMQFVATLQNNARIFIDFAHTPDALTNVLQTAQKMSHNNLHILFGCGGDRDKSKRPKMGKIACDLADFVIITDDNPRTEDAATIRKEILSACNLSKTSEIGNRREAIKQAISRLQTNDILIIAGKGHEKYQIIGNEKFEFDEEQIINNFIY